MHTANFYPRTAVRFARPAGDAGAAVEIRYDRYRFPGSKARRLVKVYQVTRQLVPQDTGVFEIRLCPFVGMQIRPADANAPYLYDRLTGMGQRCLHLPVFKFSWSYTN